LLGDPTVEVVVSELSVCGLAALQIIELARTCATPRPVIILTSSGSEYWAAESIKRGAADYVSKNMPRFWELLQASIANAARSPSESMPNLAATSNQSDQNLSEAERDQLIA